MHLSNDAIATIYDLIDRVKEIEREDTARDMSNGKTTTAYRSELYSRATRLRDELIRYEQESIKEKT